jgi:hypothetical protein
MWILTFILGVVVGFLFFETLKSIVLLNSFRQLEAQLLFAAMSLLQYKYHAIKIIEISYSNEPDKKEECEKIVAKIHEKFDGFGDSWIENLRQRLPYKTEYSDWKSAIQYVEELINKAKE